MATVTPIETVDQNTVDTTRIATLNTRMIQNALNAGGEVRIEREGTYYINSALTIYGSTRLVLAPDVVIKLLSGSNSNMLVSSTYLATPTVITGAWSSGTTFTITWTAHGKSVGDAVWLSGFAPSQFNGVFRVQSVTDANTFTVQLMRQGASLSDSTGAGVAALRDVEVSGGKWDYNSQSSAVGPANHAIILGGIDGLVVRNVRGSNATKYMLNVGAVVNYKLESVSFDTTTSDGFKLYGPAFNGVIDTMGGKCGDDMVSVQTKEPDAFSAYRWTFGDILGLRIRNLIGSQTAGSGRNLVIYGSDNEYIDDLDVDGVHGATTVSSVNPVTITGGTGLTGQAGRIYLRNVDCSAVEQQVFAQSFTIALLEIDGLSGKGKSAFQTASTLTVGRLKLRGVTSGVLDASVNSTIVINGGTFGLISVEDGQDAETAGSYYVQVSSGTIDALAVLNCDATGGSSRRFCGVTGGSLEKIALRGNNTGNLANFFVLSSVSTNPQVDAFNNECDGAAGMAFLNLSSSCQVSVGGNKCINAANGFIRTGSTPTIAIKSDGTNHLEAGSWVVVPSGTPVFTIYANDFQVDVGATGFGKTTSGQYCFNNGSGRGTLTQNRLVTCNGANWVQVDNTGNTF